MAKCDEGYRCEICGEDVASLVDSDLYLRYVIGLIDPEVLHTCKERHLRCNPSLAQFIVDPRFDPVVVEGDFDKRKLDAQFVRQREVLVTRGWKRLRELAKLDVPIIDYPLPEVIAQDSIACWLRCLKCLFHCPCTLVACRPIIVRMSPTTQPVANSYQPPVGPPAASHSNQPELLHDVCFWGMATTQFLGAFNDNLFKQLMLLIATPNAVAAAVQQDQQWKATVVFALAFILFSGFAGWMADRTSKRKLIILSKAAEIVVMLLGMVGFYYFNIIGFDGMLVVLFLMGVQSTFFGPPKYGILPEAVRERDLPRANGIFLMFTFIAIIFGVALAGVLKATLGVDRVWMISSICIGIAVLGTLTSLMVWRVAPAVPNARLRRQDLFIPGEVIQLIRSDRNLLLALLVSSVFWMLGGVVQSGVNALGLTQLGLGDGWTSFLAAMMAVGIPAGCVVGGYLSRGRINPRVVSAGAAGMFVCLVLLSLPGGPQQHLLGFAGTVPVLIALGFCTGMFVVPIQVSLQVLPPPEDKGRMIAVMNQCNFLGIIVGGFLFGIAISSLAAAALPQNLVFAVTAVIMLPIALFYRPKDRALRDD